MQPVVTIEVYRIVLGAHVLENIPLGSPIHA